MNESNRDEPKPVLIKLPPSIIKAAKRAALDNDTTLRATITDALRREFKPEKLAR